LFEVLIDLPLSFAQDPAPLVFGRVSLDVNDGYLNDPFSIPQIGVPECLIRKLLTKKPVESFNINLLANGKRIGFAWPGTNE